MSPETPTGPAVDSEEFDRIFNTFTTVTFRLEGQATYRVSVEDASVRAFREHGPRPERSVRTSPWMARIAVTTAVQGKSWTRTRVVDRPLTEYQRYQLTSYVESQAVGEQITLVDRADAGDLGPDFWLFDPGSGHAFAVVMHYTPDGRVDRRELVTDPDRVAAMDETRLRVQARAVPLNVFLAGPRDRDG